MKPQAAPPHPPRHWISVETVPHVEDSEHFSVNDPNDRMPHAIEYLPREEVDGMVREVKLEFVKHVNAVQSLIAGRMPSGESWQFLRDAWNLNAKFLSENFELQNEYLDVHQPLTRGARGVASENGGERG